MTNRDRQDIHGKILEPNHPPDLPIKVGLEPNGRVPLGVREIKTNHPENNLLIVVDQNDEYPPFVPSVAHFMYLIKIEPRLFELASLLIVNGFYINIVFFSGT
ncbi:hypothetical protein ACJX0J_030439, partial [Zea mays]